MRSLSIPVKALILPAVATVVLLTIPQTAAAGKKKLWPGQFTMVSNGDLGRQWAELTTAPALPDSQFFIQTAIPVGSKLKKIKFLYRGSGGDHAEVYAETKFFNAPGQEEWVAARSELADNTGLQEWIVGNYFEFGNKAIQNGEKVFVWVQLTGGCSVYGVVLVY
jgi:hypothetical protein